MRLFIATIFILSSGMLLAQPWYYDFGTATGVYNTPSSATELFLPPAPSGADRITVDANGSFHLENQVIAFGIGSYLRIVSSTGPLGNKFSVYGFSSTTPLATFRFLVRFGDSGGNGTPTSGVIRLVVGSGSSFSDVGTVNTNESFAGMSCEFKSDYMTTEYLQGGTWVTAPGEPITKGGTYIVDLYCNNTAFPHNYDYGGSVTLPAYTYDVWLNGVLQGASKPKSDQPVGTAINSFMIIAESSAGNTANAFIDNISYTNTLAAAPLPVELTSFTASSVNGTVNLNWATATEVSNYGFEVERSVDQSVWNKIGFVAGNGNSNSVKTYSYSDNTAAAGTVYYRLKQMDTDGQYEYSKVVSVDNTTPDAFSVDQNFPNPFNPSTTIRFSLATSSNVKVDVYASNGELVYAMANKTYEAGNHAINFDASQLSAGIYLYRITAIDVAGKTFSAVKKMQLIK